MASTSWSGQRRSFPTAMRNAILARDPVCVACHEAPSVVADHRRAYVVCLRAGIDPDSMENGQGMCGPCHDAKTRAEQRAGLARVAKRRPPERHPGDLT